MRSALNILSEPFPPETVVFVRGNLERISDTPRTAPENFAAETPSTTQREFLDRVARCAAFFRDRSELRFALHANDVELFAVWFFALLAARKEIVLPPNARRGTLARLVDRCEILVSDEASAANRFFDGISRRAVPENAFAPAVPENAFAPRALCPLPSALPAAPDFRFEPLVGRFVTFFTSGSTAEPKAIRKPFETLAAEADFHARNAIFSPLCVPAAPDATVPAARPEKSLPPCFVAAVRVNHMLGMLWQLLIPLTLGARIDADFVAVPEEFFARLRRAGGNVFFTASPAFLEKLAESAEFCAFPSRACREIFTAGSELDEKTAGALTQIFGFAPFEIFGSTESGGVASRRQSETRAWSVFAPVEIESVEAAPVEIESVARRADKNSGGCAEKNDVAGPRNSRLARVASPFCGNAPFLLSDALAPFGAEAFPRHFRLLGRTDRLVKIAENRVSLPELEAQFEAHAFVEKAHVLALDGARPALGALLVPSREGKIFLKRAGTKRALVRRLRDDLDEFFESGAFPKKIRLVNAIPRDDQGKFSRAVLLGFFKNNLAEPLLENVSRSDNAVHADATFLSDSLYFQGHFPTFPLLPGVVQVYFACVFAERFFGVAVRPTQISRLKFARIIFPNETVSFALSLAGTSDASVVGFSFKKGERVCSEGTLKTFLPAAPKISPAAAGTASEKSAGTAPEGASRDV